MPRQKKNPEADIVRISLRVPDPLKNKIEEEADINHRSLNQEIVSLIEDALRLREKRRIEEGQG